MTDLHKKITLTKKIIKLARKLKTNVKVPEGERKEEKNVWSVRLSKLWKSSKWVQEKRPT